MRKKTIFAILFLVWPMSWVIAQDQSGSEADFMAYMTPNENHEGMAKMAGEWDAELTFWMTPGAAPMVSKATCTNTMILGGRYMKTEFKGEVMGMPFVGLGFTGYDNFNKQFVSTWMDNMGTTILTSQGKMDKSGDMVLHGHMPDPMSGKMIKTRTVNKVTDDNTHSMEMYSITEEGEHKSMLIVYKRK